MPWSEVSIMDQRREFVRLAMQEGANRRELCRRFGIHPDTGYKWLGRWESDGELADRSRRPHSIPIRTGLLRLWPLRSVMLIRPGERARSPAAWNVRGWNALRSRRCTRSYAGMVASLPR